MNIRNKHLVTKFLRSFVIAFLIFLVLTAGTGLALIHMNSGPGNISASPRPIPSYSDDGVPIVADDGLSSLEEHINFVLLATDEGPRTDTMLAGTFNTNTGRIDIISLPRDTHVIMPPERIQILTDAGRFVRANGSMKLNEVHSIAGRQRGIEFATRQIEELLGIRMDFYARIDLEAFRFIVDSIGGVEFYVPIRMNYFDPTPGGARIDLQRGLQLLDGAAAEGLVRYRNSFANADLGRIQVQQDFMHALISQVVQQNMFSNIFMMMNAYLNYVDTNFGVWDIPRFLPLIGKISPDNVFTHTLPGSDEWTTRSYFIMDEVATRELINEIFHSDGIDNSEIVQESSIGKNIEILNGAGVAGIAAAQQTRLQEQGFNVTSIGDFTGARRGYTRIVVRQRGHGADLQALYEGSQIVIDTALRRGIDIQIILGQNER